MQGEVLNITKVDSIGKYTIYRLWSNCYVASKYLPSDDLFEVFTVPFSSVSLVKNYILMNENCLCFFDLDYIYGLCQAMTM